MTFAEFLLEASSLVDVELARLINSGRTTPRRLQQALEYSLFSGGKRLRPAVLLFCSRMFADHPAAITAAAALEMVHTYSLIHDDLPAMDDDDFRRGRPSLHKAFDEATAILAGDALLTLAFEALAGMHELGVAPDLVVRAIADLGAAAGFSGMIAGQMLDMSAEPDIDPKHILRMHEFKTARMFEAAAAMGALIGGAPEDARDRLSRFARCFGVFYQIADDIEDLSADPNTKGANFARAVGIASAIALARNKALEALRELAPLEQKAWWLQELVQTIGAKVSENWA